ncbi:hypothetical protein BY996DRAFT_8530233 [Phakopsora pachyrhizi]|uniref:Aspartyl/Glutamyl-tRNA(Gln) amidotransferase subunit B/E catalytic domain-containing protein n=1 Tax=Phakopsora pachyrhizi TaxID=170000 RepID=A0AAV0B8P3_PHAPC|nr:hypothetical protein BY996DRAFT_8530233 [Phakopsora pachyrhizi]CAH7682022.1 hypothetical protein PPACK8108_LOCUS14714 [Phakopsora pachyrhizi]
MTLIDLNRSGVGLIEIVTEPDLKTAKEASRFVRKLQTLLRLLEDSERLQVETGYGKEIDECGKFFEQVMTNHVVKRTEYKEEIEGLWQGSANDRAGDVLDLPIRIWRQSSFLALMKGMTQGTLMIEVMEEAQ